VAGEVVAAKADAPVGEVVKNMESLLDLSVERKQNKVLLQERKRYEM
jgi:hypothetical protein